MFGYFFAVELNTAPPHTMAVNLQLTSTGGEASGKTLVVEFAVAGDEEWTTLSSGTHYDVTELDNGIYWVEWDATNAPALFDTLGAAVARVTADDASVRSHEIGFWIYDPDNQPAQPAQMDASNWNAGADYFLTRALSEISGGTSLSGGEMTLKALIAWALSKTNLDVATHKETVYDADGSTTVVVINHVPATNEDVTYLERSAPSSS